MGQKETEDSTAGVQESFEITLKDTNLGNVITDVGEVAIDSILKEGLVRDIPVINTLIGLAKFGANVQDKLFAKKILSFLVTLKAVSSKERAKMINDIDNSKKHRLKVGEKLLYIIDSCSDYENSERVAVVFKAFVKGEISYDKFLNCASILEKITTHDFNWFLKNGNGRLRVERTGGLMSSGLFDLMPQPVKVSVKDKIDPFTSLRVRGQSRNKSPIMNMIDNQDKYETRVDGGEMLLRLSEAGRVIFSLFKPTSPR